MRLVWLVLLAGLGGCDDPAEVERDRSHPGDGAVDAGFAPIAPNDPLLGSWNQINSDGAANGAVITFSVDGTYTENGVTPAGRWSRISESVIRRCGSPCVTFDTTTRIENEYMLLDGTAGFNGGWSWGGTGSCYQHGGSVPTSWSMSFLAGGAVSGTMQICDGNPGGPGGGPCSGTWTTKPLGLTVTTNCWNKWPDYFRLSDVVAPWGYRKAI